MSTPTSITEKDIESACFREALHAFGMRTEPDSADEFLDLIEQKLVGIGPVLQLESKHVFTPGCYCRTTFLPHGTILTTKTHAQEHQFVVLVGEATVWSENAGWQLIRAPYQGITYPGTRRVIYAHSDTVWATYHPSNATNLEDLEEELIMKRANNLLEEGGAV